MPSRSGPRSAAQTPAPPSERIKGSARNPPGSAASGKSGEGIAISDAVEKVLRSKARLHNAQYPTKKVGLGTLKAVFRRGAGAYSSSHRPTIGGGKPNSRTAWAYARVNAFLRKKAGKGAKAAYVQDDDLMADGGEVKLLAPNGKPSNLTPQQWHLVRTPQFKAWFGDWENDPDNASKVVDENGEPLVVYHGTDKIFNEFNIADVFRKDWGVRDYGAYFSSSILTAKEYSLEKIEENQEYLDWQNKLDELKANQEWENWMKLYEYGKDKYKPNKPVIRKSVKVIGCFLNINNPFLIDGKGKHWFSVLKNLINDEIINSYNGMIVLNIIEVFNDVQDTFVAFHPNQIKLADGTNTTFDLQNPDIRYEDGGNIGSNCREYIARNEAVLRTGYYLDLKELASVVDPYGQVPLNLKHTLITYNSGNQGGLSLIDTINPISLRDELSKVLSISRNNALALVYLYMDKGKKLQAISDIEGDDIIIFDRDRIVCKSMDEGDGIVPSSMEILHEDGGEIDNDIILQTAKEIKDALTRLGYDVSNGAYAKTSFGHSKYLYANYEDRSMDNNGDGIKIRISDYSTTNPYRMSDEVHVYPQKDNIQQSVNSAVKDVEFRLRKELFEPTEKVKKVEHILVVGENEVNPETDEILNYEGVSKRGGKKYKIKRSLKKSYVTWEYIQKPDMKYAEGGVTGYQQRVENNLKQMGTESTEWTTVPVTGIVDTKDDKGKEVSLPTFDFTTTKGYKTPNTMYPSSSFNVCCELCGKQIKKVYWIKNDKRKYILSVGSECVTHFEEGKSGVENVREYKIELAKKYNYDIRKYEQLIEKVYFVRRKDFYGKYYDVWEISMLDESMQFVADDPKTPILKKMKQYLIERIDFMGKAPVYRDEDKFRWNALYAAMPGYVEYDEELKYAKNEKEVESLNRRVLNYYTRQKDIWTPVLEMLEQYFSLVDVSGLPERFHNVKSDYLAELSKANKQKTVATNEEKPTELIEPKMTIKNQIMALENAKKYVINDPVRLKEFEERIAALKIVLKYTK